MIPDNGWKFLVCSNCGAAMEKKHLAYQVWVCPDCGRVDGWGDQSTTVPVARGNRVQYKDWVVNIDRPYGETDYRYTVVVASNKIPSDNP